MLLGLKLFLLLLDSGDFGLLELLLVKPQVDGLLVGGGQRPLLEGQLPRLVVDVRHRLDVRVHVLELEGHLHRGQLPLAAGKSHHLPVRGRDHLRSGFG